MKQQFVSALLAGVAVTALATPALAGGAGGGAGLPPQNYNLSVSNERLLNADNEPQNWLSSNQNLKSWRYSGLTQINRTNVSNLKLVWAMSLGGANDVVGNNGPNIMANPLADNGFLYAAGEWGRVFKIDARNPKRGDLLWVFDPATPHTGNSSITRGLSMYGTSIINALQDGRVVSVNRDTGEMVWDVQVAVTNEFGSRERFNSQPLAMEGKAIVQNGAGDGGANGWVAAIDVKDGKELWRWEVIPRPGTPGAETWKDIGTNAWQHGGGGLWTVGSYDKDTRSYVTGTGNPVPQYDVEFRPGDNLYTDSAVALDIDTGKLKWYFQYTPQDGWDYDENGVHMIMDIPVNGAMKHVVGHFGRNGFYYNLDGRTGEFLTAQQYANEMNWTKGIDPKTGKPIEYQPGLAIQPYIPATRTLRGDPAERVCPTWHGGLAHQPPAFNPVKRVVYSVGTEGCYTQTGGTGIDPRTGGMAGRAFNSDLYYGGITAFDPVNNKMLAKVSVPVEIRSGVLATAGGLIFTALTEGDVVAYNDDTLEEVWSFNLGTPLKAPPMAFAYNNKQYIAVQTSGLHVHPVRFVDLMHSTYLFIFAL
jgi:alcohol dehydrogenase (cytochrome c)